MTACQTCGQAITYQGRGRPRKHCLTCKPSGRAPRPEEPEWVVRLRNGIKSQRMDRR